VITAQASRRSMQTSGTEFTGFSRVAAFKYMAQNHGNAETQKYVSPRPEILGASVFRDSV